MNEELQRHDILINEVDEKMDKVTKELQTNNMRLKGLVTKVRARGWACRAAGGCHGWGGCVAGLQRLPAARLARLASCRAAAGLRLSCSG